ncbi:SDR family oxidoreductase [Micromonospora sp. WMMD712]|uniref:SDR family oxidoreductase n=1 Tax=Micromonospora sp. WMMD712 TaxID=3016096 RepID=UPI00249C258E|nr:SDR family oxidoreductase [Micromonospora sp. WMMD712]WFE60210.1 SDR family oxidoreductase [Micromonospora sp. WMMD712]
MTPTGPGSDGPRVALVTGGASGIGWAVVGDLARHDHAVVAFDRRAPRAPLPPGVVFVEGDVTDPSDNDRAVAEALRRWRRLDVFVGNAGIHDGGVRLCDRDGPQLAALTRRVLDVDVVGYILGARATAEHLSRWHGSMVFTLSDASFMVSGNGAGLAYAAAKHACVGVVRHLAADLAPHVRVNAVAPGGVITGLRDADGSEVYAEPAPVAAAIRSLNPLGALATAEQLAPLYRFLAGPDASHLTGEILRPDGGLVVR